MSTTRAQRMAHEIQKSVAVIIQREINDPRLGIVTISSVEVSKDLSFAKIFVTFLNSFVDNSNTEKENLKILEEYTAQIRFLLAKQIKARIVPDIKFHYDSSLLDGIYMSNLVNKAVNKDKEKQQIKDEEENS